MRSRTAITTGVLAMALAAVPIAAPAAAAQDCTRGDGLLSGVAGSLCDVVNAVTDTVDGLTGNAVEPVTKGVDETADQVLGTVGDVAPTAKPTKSGQEPKPTPSKSQELLPESLGDVCLPVLSCGDQSVLKTLTPTPTPTGGTPTATPSAKPSERRKDTHVLPTESPTAPQSEPYLMDTHQPIADEPTADTDEPRIDLLWPNPFADELSVPLRDRQVVRPSDPSSDALGTALTAALLVSAILATRIVQQRRRREEERASIPFEPARVGGRHRLA